MTSLSDPMLWVIVYGLGIGVSLGILYDVLRIRRIACAPALSYGRKKAPCALVRWQTLRCTKETWNKGEALLLFFEDTLFFVIASMIVSVMIFYANHGQIRFHALFSCAIGFFAYRQTVGRLVVRVADRIVFCVRRVIFWIVTPFFRLGRWGAAFVAFRWRKRYTKHYFAILPQRILSCAAIKTIKKERRMPKMTEKKCRIHPLRVVLALMIVALIAFLVFFSIMQFRLNALNRTNEEARRQLDAYREQLNEMEADASSPLDQEDLEDYLREHDYCYPGDTYYQ